MTVKVAVKDESVNLLDDLPSPPSYWGTGVVCVGKTRSFCSFSFRRLSPDGDLGTSPMRVLEGCTPGIPRL